MSDRNSIASAITDRELAAWKKQFELELMMGGRLRNCSSATA